MPPEHTPEVLAKLDLLLALAQKQDQRMDRMDNRLDRMDSRLDRMDDRLLRLDDRLRLLEQDISEFRGEVRGRIDGLSERISDVNARLPVPIAYSPPNKPAA